MLATFGVLGASVVHQAPLPHRGWNALLYNWCGPGGEGPALNAIDEACREHDECYDGANLTALRVILSASTLTKPQQQHLQQCDASLCERLRSYVPLGRQEAFWRWGILWWFKLPHHGHVFIAFLPLRTLG
jgi:hypothetical protein